MQPRAQYATKPRTVSPAIQTNTKQRMHQLSTTKAPTKQLSYKSALHINNTCVHCVEDYVIGPPAKQTPPQLLRTLDWPKSKHTRHPFEQHQPVKVPQTVAQTAVTTTKGSGALTMHVWHVSAIEEPPQKNDQSVQNRRS